MKTTFSEEAIVGMDPTRLGELLKHRVRMGVRIFEVVTLDEAIGRLSAMGVPIVGDTASITVPVVEVESRYPAPTPEEIDELLASVASTGYASEAGEAVETWIERRYGVVGAYTAKLREEIALLNVEEPPGGRIVVGRLLVDGIKTGKLTVDPVGLEPGEIVKTAIEGMPVAVERPAGA